MSVFTDAGKKEGVEVWRMEKLAPARWTQLGEFYSGDCYIVLHTIKVRARYDLYYWLGKESSVDEKGGVAICAVELDQLLGDVPVQFREVQEYESGGFVSLWKKFGGLRYLDGGVDSAFRHVGPKEYKPRLLHVKGKHSVRVRQVSLSAASLNEGDAFVLDAGLSVYSWNGKEANRYEVLKAAEVIRFIKQERSQSNLEVVKVNDKSASAEQKAAFWKLLGGEKSIAAAEHGTDELHDVKQAKDLLLFTMAAEGFIATGVTAPFTRKHFDSNSIYLLDTSSMDGIFVWIGNKTAVDARKKAMPMAEAYINDHKLPLGTPICRIQEGTETALFKTMVSQFEAPRPKNWTHTTVASMRDSEVDIASLHTERQQATVISKRDRADEKITIWRVENFELVDVPVAQYGEFFDGDSYVIEYVYTPKKGRGEAVLYFWQGKNSTVDEKGAVAMFVTRMDNERHNGMAVQVRVPMGKEPLAFLLLLNGKMIIHKGGAKSGFRSSLPTDAEPTSVRLYHIRGESPMECKATQVYSLAASLHSNDVFVLVNENVPTLWKGRGASAEEQELGVELCERLCKAKPSAVLNEGEETEEFWNLLGGKTEYASDMSLYDPAFLPRLFQISNASGALRCEEVFNFAQEDLLEEDVMLLDAKTAVFVWIGKLANKDEIKQAPVIARQYIEAAPDNRGSVPDIIVHQGHEPFLFTSHFNWDDTPKAFEPLAELIKEPTKVCSIYPLEQLQRELPAGVVSSEKENYLSPEDFKTAFNMSKEEFAALAQWKKNELKKKNRLF